MEICHSVQTLAMRALIRMTPEWETMVQQIRIGYWAYPGGHYEERTGRFRQIQILPGASGYWSTERMSQLVSSDPQMPRNHARPRLRSLGSSGSSFSSLRIS